MMRLELATEAFIGARSQQQDAAAALSIDDSKAAILILADGLGGHESGAEASWIVVDTFRKAAEAGAFTAPDRRRNALRDAIEEANRRIAGGVDPAHGHRSMASTAVVAVVAEGRLNWISVGDSHLYLWRAGRLTKLNEDHSQAGLMVRSGQYKETDPEVQAAKSVLVSALTGRKLEIVDHPKEAYQLETGDVLVLASDGLNTISEDEIQHIVSTGTTIDAKTMSTRLVDAVKERRADRQDNTTVAIAKVILASRPSASDARTEINPPRNQITAPTALPSALQRTEISPSLPPARATPPSQEPSGSAATVPVTPAAASASAAPTIPVASPPADPGAAASPSAAAEAAARTAAVRSPQAPAPAATLPSKPLSELHASRPIAPVDIPPPKRNGWLGLFGMVMILLAVLLGIVAVGKLAGIPFVERLLGGTDAPQSEAVRQPLKDAPPAKAQPPAEKAKAAPPPSAPAPQPPPKANVEPSRPSPPEILPPAPTAAPPRPIQPVPAPAPVDRPPQSAPPSQPPPASNEPGGGGERSPEPGQAPAPQRPSGALPPAIAPPAAVTPRAQALPGTGPSPVEPRQTPSIRASRAPCAAHPQYGQLESFQQCQNACHRDFGFSNQANACITFCTQLCR